MIHTKKKTVPVNNHLLQKLQLCLINFFKFKVLLWNKIAPIYESSVWINICYLS